jgi:hypothetical protein
MSFARTAGQLSRIARASRRLPNGSRFRLSSRACHESLRYARSPKGSRAGCGAFDLLSLQQVVDAEGIKVRAVVAGQVLGHSIASYGCFHPRSQEFALLWHSIQESNWREIVRHFNRPNNKIEREEFNVSLNNVSCIELKIVCDIGGKGRASLRELFIG